MVLNLRFCRIEQFVESATTDVLIEDSVISRDGTQEKVFCFVGCFGRFCKFNSGVALIQLFWNIRESVPVVLMQSSREQKNDLGRLFKYDVSLPLKQMNDLVQTLTANLLGEGFRVRNHARRDMDSASYFGVDWIPCDLAKQPLFNHLELDICCFGHAGDQNLHLNVLMRTLDSLPKGDKSFQLAPEEIVKLHESIKVLLLVVMNSKRFLNSVLQQEYLDSTIFGSVVQYGGSISAEHGVGQQKSDLLATLKSESELKIMKGLKDLFDPTGILNPGKIFPKIITQSNH